MDLLKPLLFWEVDTSELTAKTKGSDRISPKMGISLPLFDKNSTPNGDGCIPTPKGRVPNLSVVFPPLRVVFWQDSCLEEESYP